MITGMDSLSTHDVVVGLLSGLGLAMAIVLLVLFFVIR